MAGQVHCGEFIIVTDDDVLQNYWFSRLIISAIKTNVQFLNLNKILTAHSKALSDFEASQLAGDLIELKNRLQRDVTAGFLQPASEPASHVEIRSHVDGRRLRVEGLAQATDDVIGCTVLVCVPLEVQLEARAHGFVTHDFVYLLHEACTLAIGSTVVKDFAHVCLLHFAAD